MHEDPTRGPRKPLSLPLDKAARLVSEDRVHEAPAASVYVVEGDTDTYHVVASAAGIFCPCKARTPLCSHVLAVAQVRGAERALRNGDSLTEAVA